jgi:uridylate kinase
MQETIIISLGGSIVVPELPDPVFINAFKEFILREVKNGKRFVIIVGGGKTCRNYQDTLSKTMNATVVDLDWIGIYSTRLNAELVRMSFEDNAAEEVVLDPSVLPSFKKSIIIGAGWKPGWSTDYDAVMMAEQLNAKKLINLSNIEYVYDKDPRVNKDAKKIEKISWTDFRKLLPDEWSSGLNSPFDPIAAKKAESMNMEVAIMNGRNIENLKNYLNGEKFYGTVIS